MSEPHYHCAGADLMTGDVFVDAQRHLCIETDDGTLRIECVGERSWNGQHDHFEVKMVHDRRNRAEVTIRDGKYVVTVPGEQLVLGSSAEAWETVQERMRSRDAVARLGG